MCFDFTKMAPKIKVQTLFLKVMFCYLSIFGQVRGNLGNNGASRALIWKNAPNTKWNEVVSFWRSFSLEYFSGKFGEIWVKILRTPKNLPAPTPMGSTAYEKMYEERNKRQTLTATRVKNKHVNPNCLSNLFNSPNVVRSSASLGRFALRVARIRTSSTRAANQVVTWATQGTWRWNNNSEQKL